MKLIVDTIDMSRVQILKEAIEGSADPVNRLRGIFGQADIKNINGRIYPGQVLTEAVGNYVMNKVNTHRAMGELDHTQVPSITLNRVSHLVESLEMDGGNMMGCAKILDTPNGKIAQAILKEGITLGMSSRSLGDTDKDKITVVPGMRICAIDIVSDPSAPKALVEAVCENEEWIVGPNDTFIRRAIDSMKQEADRKYTSESARIMLTNFFRSIAQGRN